MNLNDTWPSDPKLPRTYRYEVSQGSDWRDSAIDHIVELIRAANSLHLPFSVTTERSKQFRHGGNLVKADILTYVVTVGKSERNES